MQQAALGGRACVALPTRRRQQRHRLGASRVRAAQSPPPAQFSNATKLRSEAQAPFRVLRQFLLGALGASATIGSGVSTIQLVTGALGAPNAPPVQTSGSNLAIDAVVLAACIFFWRREEAARQRQMARISREERLAELRVELSSGKTTKLGRLRGFARVVLVAGSAAYVAEAAQLAEPHKAALLQRGVVFVPVVTDGGARPPAPPPASEAEKRWRAEPLYLPDWQAWLDAQMSVANVTKGAGVYVSLRLDGRVRASGVGQPPWALLAASLPPMDGVFGGWLDGMDGSVAAD